MLSVKREKRRNYIILYSVTLIVWLALLLYSFNKGIFSTDNFVENVVNNIIGIIPPILIFDFFNEKLSRDSYALETSNKITETLISNPETLELFTEEQKKKFIESAVTSIVKDDLASDMIKESLLNNINDNLNYRIRTEFDYNIELSAHIPEIYKTFFSDYGDYLYVQEKLFFRIKSLSGDVDNLNSKEVRIGFVFDNKSLDNVLRDKPKNADFNKCIFRETLDISSEDINDIKSFSSNKELFQKVFKLDLQIDRYKAVLNEVVVSEKGIVCKFLADHDISAKEHSVRIIFHMPKRYNSVLNIALMDPTRAPKISVSYPEDCMDVEMFSFFSKSEESSLEVAHEQQNGVYDISINSEWIYPVSGLVFTINRNTSSHTV